MTEFTINTTTSTAQSLGLVQDGYVGPNGSIQVLNDTAVTMNNSQLTVLGAVFAEDRGIDGNGSEVIYVGPNGSIVGSEDEAIFIDGGNNRIDIASGGSVASLLDNAILIRGGDNEISNSGHIASPLEAIQVDDGRNVIHNFGTIESDQTAIQIFGSAAGEVNKIVNTGIVSTTANLVVATNDADDRFSNSGAVFGDVRLGAGDDVYDGRSGAIDGGVHGGTGNDTYIVDDPDVALVELAGEGLDTVKAKSSFQLGDNIENLELLGGGNFTGLGNDVGNSITGNLGDNLLRGRGGDDMISGEVGEDSIFGGAGDDSLSGGEGNDQMQGGIGNDTLEGGEGNDSLHGGSGHDTLEGHDGDDVLVGGSHNDRLFGDDGEDALLGGDHNDVLVGGNDDDSLFGDGGNDLLIGGMGRDLLAGGPDADRFIFRSTLETPASADRDVIRDFSSAEGDLIDLRRIDADTSTAGDDAFTFIGTSSFSGTAGELRFAVTGAGHAIVSGDDNGDASGDFQIVVADTGALMAGDFLL